jgi:hypothetical protein|tara:strand:- start:12527 stop:12937 length:411 start_codon:yes stop_codon:yes gene_type:complete
MADGIEKAIRTVLLANSDVTDLISTRIYPYMRQQSSALPAVVYSLDNTEPEHSLNSTLNLTRATLTFECYSKSYGEAKDVAAKIKSVINGYSGTSEGIEIKSCYHDNDIGGVEVSPIGEERGLSSIDSMYVIWYVS